jgi:hypothetical protein
MVDVEELRHTRAPLSRDKRPAIGVAKRKLQVKWSPYPDTFVTSDPLRRRLI